MTGRTASERRAFDAKLVISFNVHGQSALLRSRAFQRLRIGKKRGEDTQNGITAYPTLEAARVSHFFLFVMD